MIIWPKPLEHHCLYKPIHNYSKINSIDRAHIFFSKFGDFGLSYLEMNLGHSHVSFE